MDTTTSSSSNSFYRNVRRNIRLIAGACVLIIAYLFIFHYFISPPTSYPTGSIVTIEPGESLGKVTVQFRNGGIIRSSAVFQIFAVLFGAEKRTIAGDYLLTRPENAIRLAWRVSHGSFGMVEVKVTVPEGYTVAQIGELLARKLATVATSTQQASQQEITKAAQFVAVARSDEGYLFPDTYFFSQSIPTTEIIIRMKDNFDAKIAPLQSAIVASGHSQAEIITMASILEGEATSTQDRQIVAGILWARLKAGLPLQVDSTLKYITGRGSRDLTAQDLQIDSLYNTYRYHGLPPAPIDNPGLDSIKAALNPMQTEYVYFLTGKDGVMRYAKTFVEHQRNIQKYL